MKIWAEESVWFFCILAVAVFGGTGRVMAYFGYRRVRKGARQKEKTKNIIVKNIIAEYKKGFLSGHIVQNTDALIEKYLMMVKVIGVPARILENMNLLAFIICIIMGVFGVGSAYHNNQAIEDILNIFITALIAGGVMAITEGLFLVENVKEDCKVVIADYLENHCAYEMRQEMEKEKEKKERWMKEAEKEKSKQMEKTTPNLFEKRTGFETAAALENSQNFPVPIKDWIVTESEKRVMEVFLRDFFEENE